MASKNHQKLGRFLLFSSKWSKIWPKMTTASPHHQNWDPFFSKILGSFWPIFVRFWQILVRFRSDFGKFRGPNLTDFGRFWVIFGDFGFSGLLLEISGSPPIKGRPLRRPLFVRLGSNLVNFPQFWPNFGQFRSNFGDFSQIWVICVQKCNNFRP